MKERERTIVGGLVLLILILWLGFIVHQSPRFAGSFWGGVLAVGGAVLMLVPLVYLVVKRSKWLKPRVTKRVSMRTLLAWHVYAGIVGPILVLLHTGHKFASPLGIALTAMTLIVVFSGYIGRYLMNRFSTEIREKKALLAKLETRYVTATENLANDPQSRVILQPFRGALGQLAARLFVRETPLDVTGSANPRTEGPATMLRLSQSIADVEYAIKMHEAFKRWFGKWLKFHIVISVLLYVLLALHVWAAVHFGLRWFDPWRSTTTYFAQVVAQGSDVARDDAARDDAALGEPTSQSQSDEALERFSRHFGQLFRQYWHAPVVIHGIRTTVFDYAGIATEVGRPESDFTQARQALERVNPDLLGGGNREKAFWINAYNYGAMKLAAENYPVTSITDAKISAGNPWAIPGIRVGLERYALHQIENAVLLKKFDDPRIVFAVSCAAVSCPDRTDKTFSAADLDQQLDTIVRGLLANSTKGLAIDKQRKVLTLSWILKSDRRLFGDDDGLLDFVARYAPAETRDWMDAHRDAITIEFFEHDWALNDIAQADPKE